MKYSSRLALVAMGCGLATGCDDDPAATVDAQVVDAELDVDADLTDAAPGNPCFDEEGELTGVATNVFGTDPELGAATDVTAPDFQPATGSPALTGGTTPPAGGFFDQGATYFGAIGATDWTATWTSFPTNETPADSGAVTNIVGAGTPPIATITTDTTWSGTVYLDAGVDVFVKGATLTIAAGTIIKGSVGSVIIVTKTGSIAANGTAVAPIVMTSDKATGTAARGDWSGLVLLGTADINVPGKDKAIEGTDATNLDNHYGPGVGTIDNTHDCGTLRYVRIEYAGATISPGFELQGLTLGGCGSGTDIDFLQSHYSSDDGIEVFGGNADLKHIVISSPDDDGLDWDQGWQGRVQHLVIQRATDKVMECDNLKDHDFDLPRSHPTIYNATFIGADDDTVTYGQSGIHFRRGTAGEVHNSILVGFPKFPVNVDGDPSVIQYEGAQLVVDSTYFFHAGWSESFDEVTAGDPLTQDDCAP